MSKPATQKSIYLFTLILMLTTVSVTEAKVKALTGQLMLMATLEGKPAFKPVNWQIIRSPGNKPMRFGKKLNRHTVTLDLEPGTYYVSVSLGRKTTTKKVKVKESTKQFIKISLD